MARLKRRMVYREYNVRYLIDGMTIPALIEFLSKLDLPPEAVLIIEAEDDWGSPSAKAYFSYETKETDEEYNSRADQAEKDRQYQFAQYERLKKIFEGDDK